MFFDLWIFTPYLYTSNTMGMNHLKTSEHVFRVCYILVILALLMHTLTLTNRNSFQWHSKNGIPILFIVCRWHNHPSYTKAQNTDSEYHTEHIKYRTLKLILEVLIHFWLIYFLRICWLLFQNNLCDFQNLHSEHASILSWYAFLSSFLTT